jgi:glycosyltransferase involved in cell wall biosynthesis
MDSNAQERKPGILFFVMPFAAPASVKHAQKLVDCLAPICGYLAVVGDSRIELNNQPGNVQWVATVPTLHYLSLVRPPPISAALWITKLVWVLLRACWAVVLTRRQVDVVLCFQGSYYAPVLLCARLLGKKTVSFEPGNDLVFARKAYHGVVGQGIVWVMSAMRWLTRSLCDVCAIESMSLVEQIGLEPHLAKVRVGNLYVDTDYYRSTTPFYERGNIVGFIGRLSHAKGVAALLEAAAMLKGSGLRVRIVGDGPLKDEVEAALRQPGMSHVELFCWGDDQAVVEHLNSFRLMVLPAELEGLPNTVLEAMACGTAVLATPVGGIPDLIHDNVTGFVLPDCRPATIAEHIRQAMVHPQIAEIAQVGHDYVAQRYSLSASSAKWQKIMEELLPSQVAATSEAFVR